MTAVIITYMFNELEIDINRSDSLTDLWRCVRSVIVQLLVVGARDGLAESMLDDIVAPTSVCIRLSISSYTVLWTGGSKKLSMCTNCDAKYITMQHNDVLSVTVCATHA